MLTFRARNHREWIAEVHRFISRLDKAIGTIPGIESNLSIGNFGIESSPHQLLNGILMHDL